METPAPKDCCSAIQHRLIETPRQFWSDSERNRILGHVKTCASCRALLHSVSCFEKELNPERHPVIMPDPRIRLDILGQMKQKHSEDPERKILQKFLRWKVPAYQAAAALLILLTSISVIRSRSRLSHSKYESGSEWTAYKEQSGYSVPQVQGYADSSQIGRNVLEDSLLFRSLTRSDYRHEIQRIDSVLSSGA